MNKFQIGNIVDTNIQYYKGFNENVVAPQDLRWLKDLVVLKIDKISDTNTGSEFTKPYIYTCMAKSGKTYYLNECFLELVNKTLPVGRGGGR